MTRVSWLAILALATAACSAPAPSEQASGAPTALPAPADAAEQRPVVEVLGARRDTRATVEVRLALSNPNQDGDAIDVSTGFASDPADAGTLADVHLADADGSHRYFVLREDDGRPLCSRDLGTLDPGERRDVWIRFPAPASDATAVDVIVPGFEPFKGVPLTQ